MNIFLGYPSDNVRKWIEDHSTPTKIIQKFIQAPGGSFPTSGSQLWLFWDNGKFIKAKGFWPEYSYEEEAEINDNTKWMEENYDENTRAYRWVNIPAGVFVNLNKDTCLLLELGGFYTYNITSKTKPEDIHTSNISMTIEEWLA